MWFFKNPLNWYARDSYVFKLQQYFLSHVPGADLDTQDTWAGTPQRKFHTPVTHLTSGLRHV